MSETAGKEGRFSDVRNGPKHPYQRDCTDIFCCILFCINIGVLFAFAMYGYSNGDTTNVYRATDSGGNVCGGSGSNALAYPYSYFYNPSVDATGSRVCVKVCPSYSGNTLSTLDCYNAGISRANCSYDKTIDKNGSYTSGQSAQSGDLVGYETYSVIGRVCIPTATVFSAALAN
jgi:hypothetical protein